jgi:predicted AAA+ superfamily ATPase
MENRKMVSRILKKPLQHKKSFFLLGPRGTGKTYWIKQNLKDMVYIDLLDVEIYAQIMSNPHRLLDFIPRNYQGWIVIDEVQRVPAILNEVHRLIEKEGYAFVLTGSSARSLRKKGVNLLAGRALVYHMYPLIVEELGDVFDLSKALHYGMLPALLSEPDPHAYLKAYVATYLREEVLQEGLTRNLAAFSRFLEVASFSQGQVLSMASIARETGTSQKNVSNYFDILEDLLIAYRLPIFNKRAKRQTIAHPKFYYFDVGVYQILRPKGFSDLQAEIEGAALETLFLQSLRAVNEYYEFEYQLYYWRTLSGLEVDFVLHGEKGLLAFEIKRSHTASRSDAKALMAFQEDYPETKAYLIYGGDKKYHFGTVDVLPITTALFELVNLLEGEK